MKLYLNKFFSWNRTKYYFVCYELHGKINKISNVILKDVHPVIWATQLYPDSGIITYIIFWREIDENVAKNLQVRKYFNFEKI